MNEGASRYGGIAAVLVFGIGLLAVGRIWAGLAVLTLGVLAVGLILSSSMAAKASWFAVGAAVCCATFAYKAARNEFTGTATYYYGFGRGSRSEPVTRRDSPEKFREATNFLWAGSTVGLLAGAAALSIARKLEDL